MKVDKFEKVNSELHLRISWNEEEWRQVLNLARGEIAATLKVKGFRPGKSPISSVDQFVPASRILEVAEAIAIEKAVKYLVRKHNKQIEGYRIYTRIVEKVSFSEVQLLFKLEALPSLILGKYKNLEIKESKIKINANEIQQRLNQKRTELATFKTKKTATTFGDKVVIDYVGYVDGEKLKYGSEKNNELILGSKKMIPGFEESLIGLVPGDKKQITLSFPKNYTSDLAGKQVDFKIEIKKILTPIPASDDEIVDRWKHPNLKVTADISDTIVDQIQKEREEQNKPKLIAEITKSILTNSKLEIPKPYFAREFSEMKKNEMKRITFETKKDFADYLQSQDKTPAQFDKQLEERLLQLIEEVLLIHEIAKKEKITVGVEEVDKYYEFLRNYTQKSQVDIEKMYPRSSLENHFLKYKVENFLLTNNLASNMGSSEETSTKKTTKPSSKAKKPSSKTKTSSISSPTKTIKKNNR